MNRARTKSIRKVSSVDNMATATSHILACLAERSSVRKSLPVGGRVHIDRPLPFLCVCETDDASDAAAREIANANASYLTAPNLCEVAPLVDAITSAMTDRFGAFLIVEVRELAEDILLTEDSPYTPPFEIIVSATEDPGAQEAADCLIDTMNLQLFLLIQASAGNSVYIIDRLLDLLAARDGAGRDFHFQKSVIFPGHITFDIRLRENHAVGFQVIDKKADHRERLLGCWLQMMCYQDIGAGIIFIRIYEGCLAIASSRLGKIARLLVDGYILAGSTGAHQHR
jgi:hypothetical protein